MKNSENNKKPLRNKPAQRKTSPARSRSEDSKGRGTPRKGKASSTKTEETRLNKYIAHAGICSRREADKLIEAGMVSVNGKVVTELGTKVTPEDDVRYNGERLGNERKVYLLLNKPKDYVTTLDDPHAKKTVMELISKAGKERIYPVGRLDKNTTGVLLFTNDGDLTKKLTHPSFNKKKIYQVFLDKNLIHSDMQKIAEGVKLDDGIAQVDAIAYTSADSKKEVGLEIHSGKNRIVRRIFEHLGYKVTKLDRVYFAGLTKKNLPRGRWRFLTEKEVKMLKMNAFE
jgi:23S rRNA pseudouridine2605 synthase